MSNLLKRLSSSSFGRRMALAGELLSLKRLKDAIFRERAFGTCEERTQNNSAPTSHPYACPESEGAAVLSSPADTLIKSQTREHTNDLTVPLMQPHPPRRELQSIENGSSQKQDEARKDRTQHQASSSRQTIVATSLRSVPLFNSGQSNKSMEDRSFEVESVGRSDITENQVPHELIRTWNHISHCERKIKDRTKSVGEYQEMILTANHVIDEIHDSFAHGKRTKILNEALKEATETKEQLYNQISRLEGKLQSNRDDILRFEAIFCDNWADFMRNNNLVRAPSTASKGSIISNEAELEEMYSAAEGTQEFPYHDSHGLPYEPYEPDDMEPEVQYVPIESTPSEIAKMHFAEIQEEAHEVLRHKGVRLANAQAKIEQWQLHCEDKLADFLQLFEAATNHDALELQYDLELVMEKGQATREWIEAEEDLEASRARYRKLGVFVTDDCQESNFQDVGGDGIYLNDKGDVVVSKFVDFARIERWLDQQFKMFSEIENMDDGHHQIQEITEEVSEYWTNTREVETWDSWSDVALDGARRRIDHWRDICENLPTIRNEKVPV